MCQPRALAMLGRIARGVVVKKSAGFVGLGVALGAGVGAATGNVAVGVALGIIVGAVIGAAKTRRDSPPEIQTEGLPNLPSEQG